MAAVGFEPTPPESLIPISNISEHLPDVVPPELIPYTPSFVDKLRRTHLEAFLTC